MAKWLFPDVLTLTMTSSQCLCIALPSSIPWHIVDHKEIPASQSVPRTYGHSVYNHDVALWVCDLIPYDCLEPASLQEIVYPPILQIISRLQINWVLHRPRQWEYQPWLCVPEFTLSTLPSTPPSMFSSTLPGMHARMLAIVLDGPLPACLTGCSQVSSQDTVRYTSKYTPKYTLSALPTTPPSHCQVQSQVYSQVHSRACSQAGSQFYLMSHSQPAELYAPR